MGTPHFAKEFLEHLYLKRTFDIKGVYTQAPKKANRGQKISLSAVHRFAKEKNLNILELGDVQVQEFGSSKNFGTKKRLMPLIPEGESSIRARTRCTIFSERSCSPAVMKILVPVNRYVWFSDGTACVLIMPISVPQ